jgi:hypothetical protein
MSNEYFINNKDKIFLMVHRVNTIYLLITFYIFIHIFAFLYLSISFNKSFFPIIQL